MSVPVPLTKMKQIVSSVNSIVELDPQSDYTLLGMSLEGRGLFIRETKKGSEIRSKFLNKLYKNSFIYSRLFAWKGAFDYVKEEFDGLFVSDEYPSFAVDETKADVRYLKYYFNQEKVWKEVEKHCIGVTKASRNRFKEKFFLEFEIALPSLSDQRKIIQSITTVTTKTKQIIELRKEQEKEANQLIYSAFQDAIKTADWIPMYVIAPIIRREVVITENEDYPELGIRSFGKGTFHKQALSHFEVGSKSLYRIHAGDLLFSNVFAWEGAIAVAKFEDHLRVGSHRFISCVPEPGMALPEFLCYYFLTEDGIEKINAASPGGAGRNKTLGLEKLKKLKVPVPSIEQQEEFVALKHKMDQLKKYYQETVTELEQLFPSLLNKYFTQSA